MIFLIIKKRHMEKLEMALKVARDYINLLKQEKKELIEFRGILEKRNNRCQEELRKLKMEVILLNEKIKEMDIALKHKNAMTQTERELIRKDEEVIRLKKVFSNLKEENKKLKHDKDSLIQKLHLNSGNSV